MGNTRSKRNNADNSKRYKRIQPSAPPSPPSYALLYWQAHGTKDDLMILMKMMIYLDTVGNNCETVWASKLLKQLEDLHVPENMKDLHNQCIFEAKNMINAKYYKKPY